VDSKPKKKKRYLCFDKTTTQKKAEECRAGRFPISAHHLCALQKKCVPAVIGGVSVWWHNNNNNNKNMALRGRVMRLMEKGEVDGKHWEQVCKRVGI
jgi:hypothetical protein